MAERITGISDVCLVFDEGDADITNTLGHIMGVRYDLGNQVTQYGSCGGGADYLENIHNVIDATVGVTIHPTDLGSCLAEFDPFGASSDICPEVNFKFNVWGEDASMKVIYLKDAKMGTMTVRLSKDNPVEVEVSGKAKDYQIDTGSISHTPPSASREYYLDGYVTMGGSPVGSVDNFTITVERGVEAVRGCEQVSAGDRRLPTEIIEKMRDISFDGTVEITDSAMFTHLMGNASAIQDSPSDIAVTLVLDSTTVTLTGCAMDTVGVDRTSDGEVRTLTVRGKCLGGSIT